MNDTIDPAVLPEAPPKPKQHRGFAAMSIEKRREIAAKGGSMVNPDNRSFSKNRQLAAAAGRKGGENSRGGGRSRARKDEMPSTLAGAAPISDPAASE